MTYHFQDIRVQVTPILGALRKFTIFRLPLLRRLVRYNLHIWPLGRSNGRCIAVTLDDLDLLLWHWYTFKVASLKAHISETITATATLSCTVIQLAMLLEGTWHMWPWPSQNLSNALTSFLFPVCRWRTVTFMFGRMADGRDHCSLLFLADLDLLKIAIVMYS